MFGAKVFVPLEIQTQVRYIVVDPHREVQLGVRSTELVEDRSGHGRREFFGREAVPAADHSWDRSRSLGPAAPALGQGGHDVEIKRLAQTSRLLGAVQGRDGPGRGRECRDKCFGGERAVQSNLEQPHPLAAGDESSDGFLRRAGGRAENHGHPLGVGRAHIVEETVLPPDPTSETIHGLLHDIWHGLVKHVHRLAGLEEHVRVLRDPRRTGRSGDNARSRWACTRSSSIIARTSSGVS